MTHFEAGQLFTHMEWADSLIWKSVLATDAAREDRTVLERLHHIHTVQHIYLRMWQGAPDRGRELDSFGDLHEVLTWAREYYQDLRQFLENLDAEVLSKPVEFPWAGELVKWFGEARSATGAETIIQVAMHTSHHRGQLCTMIRQFGGEPPLVDFVGWVWMGKPDASWPAEEPA